MGCPACPDPLTHAGLVLLGHRWLKQQGCWMVLRELVTTCSREIPDVIGWREEDTYLIECKTSRSDFLVDLKKAHRVQPERGIGTFRYYLCRDGMIRPEELPERWGLLYATDKRVSLVAGKDPRTWFRDEWLFSQRNQRAELGLLRSALQRVRVGVGPAEFERLAHQSYGSQGSNERPDEATG